MEKVITVCSVVTTPLERKHEQLKIQMRQFEDAVKKSDDGGIRARWESGRYMLTLRQGKKQLPNGLRETLAADIKVDPSELTARMKFAEKYPTEEKLATAISKFKNWFAIKQRALPDKPRPRIQQSESAVAEKPEAPGPSFASSPDAQAPAEPAPKTKTPETTGTRGTFEPEEQKDNSTLQRILALVKTLDPATFVEGDFALLGQIDRGIRSFLAAVKKPVKKKEAA